VNSANATGHALGGGSLAGRGALVTGAGGRIGAQIARVLAREGAAVVVADRDESSGLSVAEAIASSGCASFFIAVDMADAESVRAMVDEAHRRLGQVDILVNNAAATHLTRTDGALVGLNRHVWDEAIAVNLTGPMLASQHTIEYMIERGTSGSLVYVSSAAGLRGDDQLTAYSVSKAGIFALSRQIAVQCGRFGSAAMSSHRASRLHRIVVLLPKIQLRMRQCWQRACSGG
jgi:NAD(P)-dependent dehydrogenase (short-subunit alcohol dehydrogenase family)